MGWYDRRTRRVRDLPCGDARILLPSLARSRSNYRLYGPAHVERLRFIRHCRSPDMTHDEIRTLLAFRDAPAKKCDEVNALLDEHIGHVARRIRELKVLKREFAYSGRNTDSHVANTASAAANQSCIARAYSSATSFAKCATISAPVARHTPLCDRM